MSDARDSRRNFLKTLGLGAAAATAAAAAAPVLAATAMAAPQAGQGVMPKRMLGKTGVEVPILNLGGMFDTINNQLLLRQALNWGVSYWDTAEYYGRGLSEEGFGRFFQKNPDRRKDVFLVTKLTPKDGNFPERFEKSLARLQTTYVDLFFVHGIDSMSQIKPDVRAWMAQMKQAGKIRFTGFSTHANMEDLMQAAAKEGGPAAGYDVIMSTYNTSVMHKPAMQAAVEACAKAGIGLVAMKTQGMGPALAPTPEELKVAELFLKRGFTDKQARLKAVWENTHIASICSQMPSVNILASNVAAARDQTALSAAELGSLYELACAESAGYCGGCGSICQSAAGLPVNEVMRCLMYHREYDEPGLGRSVFAELPDEIRARLASADYSRAEAACPHGLKIAKLMREAVDTLA